MNRSTPLQQALASLIVFTLLGFVLLWFSNLDGYGWFSWKVHFLLSLALGLLAAAIVWAVSSITDLRRQTADLRAEIERLKNKE